MRRAVLGVLGLLALSLPAADVAAQRRAVPDLCPDRGVRWFGAAPTTGRLLAAGIVKDPDRTGGRIELLDPFNDFSAADLLWLRVLPQIDIYLRPQARPVSVFAPEPGAAEGVYRLHRVAAPDPRCAPYERHVAALRRLAGPGFTAEAPAGTCIHYEFIGPLRLEAYDFLSIVYEDERPRPYGLRRWNGDLLDRSGRLIARGSRYSSDARKGLCATPPPYYPEQTL